MEHVHVMSQVLCIVERCGDGSIAPVPGGQCCPSARACPRQQYVEDRATVPAGGGDHYSKGADCSAVTCYLAR